MKAKTRVILEECIEHGLQAGIERAHKHTDTPKKITLMHEITNYIWLEIDEHFTFEDENEQH